MLTVTVGPATPGAIQLVSAGDGPTLISNGDQANTVYLGDNPSFNLGIESIPLAPSQFVAVDGTRDVYAEASPGQTAVVYVIPGGMSFFQLLRRLLIEAGTSGGLFVYSGQPALGNLIASIVAVSQFDQFGNFVRAGINSGENSFGTATNIFGSAISFFEAIANPLVMQLNTGGLFLYPAGQINSPSSLETSVANAAGFDGVGNPFPAGFFGQQLTLANQSSIPATPTNAAILYVDGNGNIERLLASGRHAVLADSSCNTNFFTVSLNSLLPISATWGVPANDVAVSTQYEVEVWGTGVQGNPVQGMTIQAGGGSGGPREIFPSSFAPAAGTYTFWARATYAFTAIGASGAANVSLQGIVESASQIRSAFSGYSSGVAFNTTAPMNLVINASVGGSGGFITGQNSTFSRKGA